MTAHGERRATGAKLAFAALLLAGAAALTLWIFSRPGTPAGGYDWLEQQVFHKHLYREAVGAGRLPLWTPFVGLGRPFLADIESATLYPPNLIFLLPAAWALPLSVVLHVALILGGTALLGRELGLRRGVWALAGVTFALSAAVAGRLQAGQFQVFCTLAHLPLWWAVARRAWREPGGRSVSVFALVGASALLAGSPPFFWAMAWMLGVWLAALAGGEPWRAGVRGAGAVAAGGLLAAGVAAVQLVPFAELVREGNRAWVNPEFAALGVLPWRNLLSLLVPTGDGAKFFWEMNLFAGVAAPAGLVLVWQARRDPAARAFAAVAMAGLWLALPPPFGLAGWLAEWVPGMAALRLPSRYALVAGWALALVALVHWNRRPARPAAALAWTLAAAQIASLLWAVHRQSRHYVTGTVPAAETALAQRAVQLAAATAPVPLRTALASDAIRANAGALHGFANLDAFANPGLRRVWAATHTLAGIAPRPGDFTVTAELANQPRAALARWGVQFGWDFAAGALFYAADAAPRAQAVTAHSVVADARAAARGWWETPTRVWLETPPPSATIASPPVTGTAAAVPPMPLRIVRYEPERLAIEWPGEVAGWLVVAEPWYPGWQVRTPDGWREMLPANGWMRAAWVPAGRTTVELAFRPRTVRWGAAISAVSLVLAGVLAWRRRT